MTDQNIDILARTIFGEQRGHGKIGMQSVANVVMNRTAIAKAYTQKYDRKHPLYGDGTIASCCKMPWQFSCWNKNDPNLEIITNANESDPVFADALEVANDVTNGVLDDITKKATHYYSVKLHPEPSWAKDKIPCEIIAGQYFFNNIE